VPINGGKEVSRVLVISESMRRILVRFQN